MLPTEQADFFRIVTATLNAYGRFPEPRELEAWWQECRGLSLDALEAALKAHRADQDRGERAPRPVDITRRMKTGQRNAQNCAAVDPTGQCQYPGIFSDGTTGDGPWYCPWHRTDRVGDEASRWIEVSRRVPFEEARAKQTQRHADTGATSPAAKAVRAAMSGRRGNFAAVAPKLEDAA